MGACIICGASVDGHICESHQEDVVFDFRGDDPHQLVSNRFYRGTVDGYADFGVFVDLAPGVTGLLHRSELDRRLESLSWEPGDSVFVRVKNVRDNGNVDLGWSIRQSDREFRGTLIQEGGTSRLPESETDENEGEDEETADEETSAETTADDAGGDESGNGNVGRAPDAGSAADGNAAEEVESETTTAARTESAIDTAARAEPATDGATTDGAEADTGTDASDAAEGADDTGTVAAAIDTDADASDTDSEAAVTDDSGAEPIEDERERVEIGTLEDRIDDPVRIEGEVVGVQQTGGPTVFEVRDETGVVDVAAFVEPGVRAYPAVELGDVVRIHGDVERRREEIQIETEALAVLEGEEAETVERRLASAITERARPDAIEALGDDATVQALSEPVLDAAEAIRRAVLESRPIVVRHPATADGYVAGAAIERATLPLIREEHSKRDAVYHYFTRRPLEGSVYGMDAATNDVTRMLQDRDRHDEKLPLFLLVGTGSTVESADGIGLLDVYDATSVVVDAAVADPETRESADTLVSPELADVDGTLSTGALVSSLAATVNGEVREDLTHLPAVSYWEDTPDVYAELAREAGYDAERVTELREAIELEAYYQSYEDKRELVTDLLFEDGGDLAAHVAEQFREKLETEIETARANLRTEDVDGIEFAVLDTDAYSHRYDFPPETLLVEELHRRVRDGRTVTLGIGTDELYVRSTFDLAIREVAADVDEIAPEADVTTGSVRDGKLEFLSGARDAVENAVIAAIAEQA